MTRTGRPIVPNPKNVKYSIRMDAELENELREYCDQNSVSKGEAIRTAIKLMLTKEKRRRK